MATNYPGAIDSLTNPSAGDALTSPSHSAQHANANDAIKAIETELGTDPSGASATVKARFEAIEANDWVTSARIAADAVGSSELADNAVDTNAIQDGAVTSAKVADGAVGSSELADNAVDTAAIQDNAVTAPKFAAGAMSAVLLAVARAQPVVSGGDAFDGPDPMWETIFGEPFADAGTPSAGTPAHTFDGGAAA